MMKEKLRRQHNQTKKIGLTQMDDSKTWCDKMKRESANGFVAVCDLVTQTQIQQHRIRMLIFSWSNDSVECVCVRVCVCIRAWIDAACGFFERFHLDRKTFFPSISSRLFF